MHNGLKFSFMAHCSTFTQWNVCWSFTADCSNNVLLDFAVEMLFLSWLLEQLSKMTLFVNTTNQMMRIGATRWLFKINERFIWNSNAMLGIVEHIKKQDDHHLCEIRQFQSSLFKQNSFIVILVPLDFAEGLYFKSHNWYQQCLHDLHEAIWCIYQ